MSTTSRPQSSIAVIVSARLGIQPPGKTCLRMKNSVSNTPTWPMKCSMPEPARLQEIGVRVHHLAELVAAGVLEHADRDHLVELRVHLAEIGVTHVDPSGEPAPCDLAAQPVDLLVRGVDRGAVRAVVLGRHRT